MMEQKEKVRFRSFSIKEEKGRTTLLARKRVVKSQLTMFLIPLWSDVLARAIQNTKYKIQNTKYNTRILMCLQGAIQAAVKPPDCGLIVQNNTSSHKMHPIIVNLIPKEATSSLPLLMRSTLCSSSRLRCLWMLRSLCCAPQPPLNPRPSISARPASVIERRRIPEQEEEWEGFGWCVCVYEGL